jgi:hypothetical protein
MIKKERPLNTIWSCYRSVFRFRVLEMKKHQLGIWLGLCAAITVSEIAALSTPANAQNCSAYNSSVVTSVR